MRRTGVGRAVSGKKKPVTACYLCRSKVDDDDDRFCYGCKVVLCEKCDINMCTGKHVPIDHYRQLPGEYSGT